MTVEFRVLKGTGEQVQYIYHLSKHVAFVVITKHPTNALRGYKHQKVGGEW